MRRIVTMPIPWTASVSIGKRDYRLLLAVARAVEAYTADKRINRNYSSWAWLLRALDKLNAKGKGKVR